jgi:uncharacterized membrane protein YvbJ
MLRSIAVAYLKPLNFLKRSLIFDNGNGFLLICALNLLKSIKIRTSPVKAIVQLATATASDRGTVATLTTTNAKLATQLEAAHAFIAQLKSEIATLKIKIKPV